MNRAYLEAVLERLGHRAVFAADGDTALRAVEAQPADAAFDIVLMDLHMPGMDGFAAARAIRALPAPRGTVPIVALTADAFQATRQLAFEAGMDGFLTKPAHLPQLREVLARHAGAGLQTAAPAPAETAAVTPIRGEFAADDPVPLLDAATVDALSGALAPAKYAELLASLLAGRVDAVAGLRDAAHAARRAELRSLAHALKGAALSMGLQRVGMLAAQLQTSAPTASTAELIASIDQLEQQFDASLAECRRLGLLAGSSAAPGLTPPAAPAPA